MGAYLSTIFAYTVALTNRLVEYTYPLTTSTTIQMTAAKRLPVHKAKATLLTATGLRILSSFYTVLWWMMFNMASVY